jgi:probable addiction module antidote protein
MKAMKAARSHDEATIEMLRRKPALAQAYLQTALEEIDEPKGEAVFLMALRQVALARGGIARIAEEAGMKREAVSRALSPRGNPTLRTLAGILKALGVRLEARMSTRKKHAEAKSLVTRRAA